MIPMPHYTEEQIAQARQMDLLTYLQTYEPSNLKRICADTYCTNDHDSLKISNGMWHWFSRGIGGKSALDYLMAVKEYSFQEALETLLGRAAEMSPVTAVQKEKSELNMPVKSNSNAEVERYLRSRGICSEVIRYCIRTGIIYEGITEKNGRFFHNAVFVGKDEQGIPKYAALRGCFSDFKGEAHGSDKRYAFSIPAENSNTLHLFEAAIDLLSYATLEKLSGRNWRRDHLLSLAGVYDSKKQELPLALERYLSQHEEVKTICLHLDNDEIGRAASKAIMAMLSDRYDIRDIPPAFGKDVNDELLSKKHFLSRDER